MPKLPPPPAIGLTRSEAFQALDSLDGALTRLEDAPELVLRLELHELAEAIFDRTFPSLEHGDD